MQDQGDQTGLGLGDISELAAAAGGTDGVGEGASVAEQQEPAEQDRADKAEGLSGDPAALGRAISGGDASEDPKARRKAAHAKAEREAASKAASRAQKEADELATLTGDARAKHDRKLAIRARLEEIGDPFALRQGLAQRRAEIIEERRKTDDALRQRLAAAETALAAEQEKAQWVAKEKHDLEAELAKLG